ncbi:MAG: cyclodeaminase/cyclohydrolase family protein [Firmicutes bacterium]|nr:cyclodeaminase/cyclohydrolase family protein [Bacillota bacterium]
MSTNTIYDTKVGAFLDALASGEPAPGGGAAAALSGAMAAALVAMVCGLTVGREKFREVEGHLQAVLDRATMARANFLLLAERDQAAFNAVMGAYALPRATDDTDEDRAARQAAIQSALQEATRVPLSTLQQALELLPQALDAVEHGNPNARSDGAGAYFLAQAALDGALLNVKINLSSIKDEGFKAGILDQVGDALASRRQQEARMAKLLQRFFPD